ncbi:Hg(II)-responsive transcriptional regulator [Pseudomonas sp. BN417]|uniref:Hg(II)-responsive transcriptional regulator n=1 Tax=Pseudomonas sp. BN417 TaxID=2567890 RepID=UPI002456261B|nr:Hg(II)-responsive transcriptional regulator [Pseudomonas sp. BN417]MDH4556394.1 Hg(II)-responsive transcriptional regulator [Pseudomonas sp. BN417]
MANALTIGKLAEAAEVNIETIRYYQRRGLLQEPAKPLGGYRRYAPDQVKRVRFIKRAQALGFTLAEVGDLLKLAHGHTCAETQALAVRKLRLIEEKIADLAAMQQALGILVRQCDAGSGKEGCPIIEVLARD